MTGEREEVMGIRITYMRSKQSGQKPTLAPGGTRWNLHARSLTFVPPLFNSLWNITTLFFLF